MSKTQIIFYKYVYSEFEKFLPFTPYSNKGSVRYWCCHPLEGVLFGAFSKFTANLLTQSMLCAQADEYMFVEESDSLFAIWGKQPFRNKTYDVDRIPHVLVPSQVDLDFFPQKIFRISLTSKCCSGKQVMQVMPSISSTGDANCLSPLFLYFSFQTPVPWTAVIFPQTAISLLELKRELPELHAQKHQIWIIWVLKLIDCLSMIKMGLHKLY